MKPYSCIIFDLDGTLTHTNQLIFASFNRITEKYLGKTYTPSEITALFGPPEEIAIERLVGKEQTEQALKDFFDYYETHHDEMADAYNGIRELIGFLKQKGVLLAIFTGKGRRSALITLEYIGLVNQFDMIVSGTDVVRHKPSGEGILKVMEAFNLRADEVLMVGDAVSDIIAAREAGVAVASVVWDSYSKDRVMEINSRCAFHSVEEFSRWINNLYSAKEQQGALVS